MSQLVESKMTTKKLFSQENVKKKFNEILGDKANGFIASVMQVASDPKFATVDPYSVYNAAAIAASLDLVINNSIGLAYIIPYKNEAQFQISAKGFTQLALRSGQYEKINAIEVYENQFKSFNKLTEELDADFSVDGEGEVVGYCAYMKLLNGFTKTVYWSKKEVVDHAKKYSKTYKYDSSVWKQNFDAMARKTVLKAMLSRYGILSIEMRTAITTDQGIIKDAETMDVDYVDVTNAKPSKTNDALDAVITGDEESVQTTILDEIDNPKK